jgi:hypothetical protein
MLTQRLSSLGIKDYFPDIFMLCAIPIYRNQDTFEYFGLTERECWEQHVASTDPFKPGTRTHKFIFITYNPDDLYYEMAHDKYQQAQKKKYVFRDSHRTFNDGLYSLRS